MPNIEETLISIEYYYKTKLGLIEDLRENSQSPISQARKDEMQAQIEEQIKICEKNRKEVLEELLRYPPYHLKHFPRLSEFHNSGIYEKSVFIMTKFPNEQNPQQVDNELKNVIDSVKAAITNKGFVPRMASDKKFQPGLWDNVEMYLLGCGRGVAIVEDKYLAELNPNVTMEWGWMRGMNKDVLFLVENTFDLGRADISGLIQDKFDWNNPNGDIVKAINNWLP